MARPGTKPRIDEEIFKPRTLEEALALHCELVAHGVGKSRAWTIIDWLLRPETIAGSRAGATRSEFRTELLALGEPPWLVEPATLLRDTRSSRDLSRCVASYRESVYAGEQLELVGSP